MLGSGFEVEFQLFFGFAYVISFREKYRHRALIKMQIFFVFATSEAECETNKAVELEHHEVTRILPLFNVALSHEWLFRLSAAN
tara:strand:- start:228 stop:479 length:252 start_codon:yes stop_codon:yes gene_type:complete